MTQPTTGQATDSRVALFCAAQLREATHSRIVQSFGKFAQGQGPGPSDEDLRLFAKLVAQERRLKSQTRTDKYSQAIPMGPARQPEPGAALQCEDGSRQLAAPCAHDARAPSARSRRTPVRAAAAALLSTAIVAIVLVVAGGVQPSSAPPAQIARVTAPPRVDATAVAKMAPGAVTSAGRPVAAAEPTPEVAAASSRAMTAFSNDPSADQLRSVEPARIVGSSRQEMPTLRPQGRPTTPRVTDRAIRSALAECDGLNFLASAICMNNKCADRRIGRSAQCVEPLRQRKLDEARRNPTLVG